MDSGLDDPVGRQPKEERVNQWPEGNFWTRQTGRPAPGAYGSVHPAQDQARRLAERMRESLAAVGFDVDHDFPSLRGDTTVSHEPFVTLGRLSADVGERLIAALAGTAAGRAVGGAVGATAGGVVGAVVGTAAGRAVGTAVGTAAGTPAGRAVGAVGAER